MEPTIWVEKYRPKTINDVIFQDTRQKNFFSAFVENKDIPNILMSGSPGTGKSTISNALIRDLNVDRTDRLKINCSDGKIDAMRSKVQSFAMTMPIGKFKVVQLEEFDLLSLDAMGLLRNLIEDTSTNCRFIATCNYINRIIPPLKSRFQEFYFKAPDKEKIALRMVDILESEKVTYDPEDLLSYIDVGYPDIRKTIQLLQQHVFSGKLLSPKEVQHDSVDWKFGLLDTIISGDFNRARKLVCETATREEHEDVFRFLYENVNKMKVNDKDSAILIIADHLFKHGIIADTEINLAACFISLGRL